MYRNVNNFFYSCRIVRHTRSCLSVCYRSLIPILQKLVKIGSPKHAKHAVKCIRTVCKNSASIFKQIFTVSETAAAACDTIIQLLSAIVSVWKYLTWWGTRTCTVHGSLAFSWHALFHCSILRSIWIRSHLTAWRHWWRSVTWRSFVRRSSLAPSRRRYRRSLSKIYSCRTRSNTIFFCTLFMCKYWASCWRMQQFH